MSPYSVLGLETTATPEEIKAQYRKLVKRYHPDRNQGDVEALENFRKVQEAYEALTKPQPEHNQHDPFGGFSGFSDIFSGFGFQRRNRDYQSIMQVTLEELYEGCEKSFTLGDEVVTIRVDRGTHAGSRYVLHGRGDHQFTDLPAGDLHVVLDLIPHDRFEYRGDDLIAILDIDVLDLVLGTEKTLETISGSTITVKVPEATQVNSRLRVRQHGMPIGQDNFGDLIIVLRPVVNRLDEPKAKKLKKVLDSK